MVCLYIFIGILLYVELYSLGIYFVARKLNYAKPYKNFIPFYAFKTIERVTMGFSILMIPVRKAVTTMVILAVAVLLACAYGLWGNVNLPEVSRESLWQIMLVIVVICSIIFFLFILASSIKVYRRFEVAHEWLYVLFSLPLVTVPFLYMAVSRNTYRKDCEMY